MRLLIITQKIDKDDPILGFFHGWVKAFSEKFKSIVVICLERKNFDLPDNVAVLSLGKEKWKSKIKYIFLLFYFSLRYYNRYDAVFVHMNEEYPVIAGWLWRLMGKKVFMWRNHNIGNTMTDIASIFCNNVFCTSKYSYTAKYKKTILMPIGIDTNLFKQNKNINKIPKSILFLSRIAPSKNVNVFIDALIILKNKGIDFIASIYGDALLKDFSYLEKLHSQIKDNGLEKMVKFYGGIPNYKTPEIYNSHEIFVNLSSRGMYDKTIFESMLCGCLLLASNDNLKGNIDNSQILDSVKVEEVSEKLEKILSLSSEKKNSLIDQNIQFANTQSLEILSNKLVLLI